MMFLLVKLLVLELGCQVCRHLYRWPRSLSRLWKRQPTLWRLRLSPCRQKLITETGAL